MPKYNRRYTGPGSTGVCVCGCRWDDHHLGLVMNQEYIEQTTEVYIPQECEAYGFDQCGGMKFNEETGWEEHCSSYRDSGLTEASDEPPFDV